MKEYIKSLNILTDNEFNQIDTFLTNRTIKKGDFLVREGEICEEIAFIKQGVLRSYFIDEKGEEITNCITFENQLMSAYSSYITQKPTQENIQAIVDTEIQFIPKKDMETLFDSSTKWQKVGRVLAEEQYINLENRILSFQKDSAVIRYQHLFKNNPQYIKQIPLHYISSYLGISTRHLTRIRKAIL